MSTVQVLGPGCKNCQILYERTQQAAQEIGLSCQIEKITDMETIVGLGVLSTPALVVDGALRLQGRVPTVEQLKEILA
ncbi:MAG: TM0996/MTH895 family glutaredoxin-like protein [Candidatus Eisenbacteria bacterium]|nr:TM0996/MTH895 family glutaredoxin-like protein [Candidatus Eisenbacteria bacterium]